jgi:hypothetical protein
MENHKKPENLIDPYNLLNLDMKSNQKDNL